jgi:hypothetical protein
MRKEEHTLLVAWLRTEHKGFFFPVSELDYDQWKTSASKLSFRPQHAPLCILYKSASIIQLHGSHSIFKMEACLPACHFSSQLGCTVFHLFLFPQHRNHQPICFDVCQCKWVADKLFVAVRFCQKFRNWFFQRLLRKGSKTLQSVNMRSMTSLPFMFLKTP